MQHSFKARACVGAAATLLVALTAVAPALGDSNPTAALAPLGTPAPLSPVAANGTSTVYGGWEFALAGATKATSQFKIPSLACTSTTSGVGPGTFMLTGSSSAPNFNAAGLAMECSGGAPAAQAEVIVDGAVTFSTRAVFVGDVIRGTVTTSSTTTTATVQDLTAGHRFKFTRSGAGAAALKELLINDSLACSCGAQLPVANFGVLVHGSGSIDGNELGSVSPREAFNMETSTHVLQIVTGRLKGSRLSGFSTTWKHS